ncbi:hypothetical protein Tcan_18047 [Toxocara canis]|uniref:Uncharacterized protein n=1 Tax=Toxocara canis TaxID=6265 RepID=A0A0B2VBU9_TOXCA|nr:hypothetical protein Tcan_18047 [Toxocara canis]
MRPIKVICFALKLGSFEEERFTWQLVCAKSKFIFGDFDELRRTHWIPEMQLAAERRTKAELLEYDRSCSKRAENLTPTEKNLTWRLALESENARLMQLLDDERRALHDEEIVRTLAARMLDEERERREKLEKKLKSVETRLAEQMRNETNFIESDKEKQGFRQNFCVSEMQLAAERRTKAELLEYDRSCSKRAENLTPTEKNLTWRLALESENARLMQLLDDERRALHDEEIVRTLAARMLDEERERREKLEKKLKSVETRLAEQMRNETNFIESDKENIKKLDDEATNCYTKFSAQSL